MKKCLSCTLTYSSQLSGCEHCGWLPNLIQGRTAYSPDLAFENSNFKADYFAELATLEAKNFWFRARNQLIIWTLEKYSPDFNSFLEIGCGTGYVLSGLADAFPNRNYSGSELLVDGLGFAEARQKHAMEFIQMDARDIPYVDEFDAIGSFDVLEHIEEDSQVLKQIYQALKPQGILLLTVPQHQWLWSQADEFACHVRRYSADELHQKVKQAGFEILRSTSFVFSLLPLMMISRLRQKSEEKNNDPYKELRLPFFLNKAFEKILATENYFIRQGINFPLGGSRLLVARKKEPVNGRKTIS